MESLSLWGLEIQAKHTPNTKQQEARNNFPLRENKTNLFSSLFSPPTSPILSNRPMKLEGNHTVKMNEIDFSTTERYIEEKVEKNIY